MSYAITRFNADPSAQDDQGNPIPVDNLVQTTDKLNANLEAIKAALDTLEGQQHQLAAGVNYIQTSFTGHPDSLDKIDGEILQGGEMAGVFIGDLPSTLYFVVLVPDSGATPDPPFVTAPATNAGTKRWVLGARTRRVWLGQAPPSANNDIASDHVFGDYWFYGGNVWLCTSHAQGAAVWQLWLKVGTGANDAAAGNHTHTGYATLVDGKVPQSQLPAVAITETHVVASQAGMLALTAQTGDVAVRTDLSESFILLGTDPTQLSNWQQLLSPPDAVTSVDGRTGTVSLSDLYLAASQATATPTASKIPVADAGGKLDGWITPDKGTRKFIKYTIDGGGAVIATGFKGFHRFNYTGAIVKWSLFADQPGSIAIDIWKHASGGVPTASDKITSTTGPSLSAAQTVFDSTSMSGWSPNVTAGDMFAFYVASCSTITRVVIELEILVS